jgi:1-acyl-sn-glycerol-3-phosphate acyltransferase
MGTWPSLRERLFYPVLQRTAGAAILKLCRTTREGTGRVPPSGGIIVAFNHPSFLDVPLLVSALPRPLYFIGKREVMGPSWIVRITGQIPLDKAGGSESALTASIGVLEEGRALGIAPEGTRTHDGKLRRGMTGIATIAFTAGAPIVPVALEGTYEAWPRSKTLPRPFVRTRVLVGEPIEVERDLDAVDDPRRCRDLTDLVMVTIADLLGQPYDYPGVRARPGSYASTSPSPDEGSTRSPTIS